MFACGPTGDLFGYMVVLGPVLLVLGLGLMGGVALLIAALSGQRRDYDFDRLKALAAGYRMEDFDLRDIRR
jgi:hypothetical protein